MPPKAKGKGKEGDASKGKPKKGKKGGPSEATPDELIDEMFYVTPLAREKRREMLTKRIREAFMLFERDNSGLCDKRELGTIIRSLNINPTETQLKCFLEDVEPDENTGMVRFVKFLDLMLPIMMTNEYRRRKNPNPEAGPAPVEIIARHSEETILQAFETLDTEGKAYLDSDQLKELLMAKGEVFTNEEVIEMLNAAQDPETTYVKYDEYVSTLAND
eukprot:RCo049437